MSYAFLAQVCAAGLALLAAGCSPTILDLPTYHAGEGRGVESFMTNDPRPGLEGTSFVVLGPNVGVESVDGRAVRIGYIFHVDREKSRNVSLILGVPYSPVVGPDPTELSSRESYAIAENAYDYDSLLIPGGPHTLVLHKVRREFEQRQHYRQHYRKGDVKLYRDPPVTLSFESNTGKRYIVLIESGTRVSDGQREAIAMVAEWTNNNKHRMWLAGTIIAGTNPEVIGMDVGSQLFGQYFEARVYY